MMMALDVDNGNVRIDDKYTMHGGMSVAEIPGAIAVEGPFMAGRDKIYRVLGVGQWLDYEVDTFAARFANDRCEELIINLFDNVCDNDKNAHELLITKYLRHCVAGREQNLGLSAICFRASWALLTVVFDFKMCAPSVHICYK